MTIPPFPSQDLAKLVLGYLAEEQLMTAYDEFLQASPYLDALGNEYDRIFMTSLKNILAEYRAVKIYVETCKPFILRKKIFQCTNLLEMVKFLIQNVDVNKIQTQESSLTKISLEKMCSGATLKTNICDVCSSLKLDSCLCKSKSNASSVPSNSHISTSSLENSIETTPLSDLPGNHVTCRKKNARVCNKDLAELSTSSDLNERNSKLSLSNAIIQKTFSISNENVPPLRLFSDPPQNNCVSDRTDSLGMRQKEEFNTIYHQVCNKNTLSVKSKFEDIQTRTSATGYDDFATGVKSGGSDASLGVPDSSTSENLHIQIPAAKDTTNMEKNAKVTQTKTQYLLKVANVKNNMSAPPSEVVSISTLNSCTLPRKTNDESKIKILSDIKVDKQFIQSETTNKMKMPAVLKNATSTPLLQMQTIVINGTPVYKHQPFGQKNNYTKDEIMAMPTIILAPIPGTSQVSVSQSSETTESNPSQYSSTISSTCSARQLSSLTIDADNANVNNTKNISDLNVNKASKLSPIAKNNKINNVVDPVVKNLDITSASAPKDNTVTGAIETSTPQVLPFLRKSSSTPRRTSHVRVLDFTTPRRILHETINEYVPDMAISDDKEVVSEIPNLSNAERETDYPKLDDNNVNSKPIKEKTEKKFGKKKDWDTDLRVLATMTEKDVGMPSSPKHKPKPKPRKSKAPKNLCTNKADKTSGEKSCNKKKSQKPKLSKNKPAEEDIETITIPDENEVPVKPTINIIAGVDRNPNTSAETHKSQNRSNNNDNIDTPEMERISLQNEIGGKLNISDLLETPYKQVLYDIQMETPRFLGPDLPDDPMSDIKIMNIPTPRFLNTATPSSYSSRPTDYSSGGSYYKPEEQDYMRIHDELDCPVTSSKETISNLSNNKDNDDSKEKENMKPCRPVRECTRNVSYNFARSKNSDIKEDLDSSIDSTSETIEKPIHNTPITPKVKENKTKSESSKKISIKKRKSPSKKEMVKSFMKIKPRRPTPTKNNVRKRKSIEPASMSKVQTRKKASTKDITVSATPVINSVPTKSRRKSSTPRKLHCTKSFNSDPTGSSGHDLPEFISKGKENLPEANLANIQDSDTEQLPLRWSDDGSQEPPQPVVISIPNETEDIRQIKEYIETTIETKQRVNKEDISLHIDLVKRGFDLETAKIIERDLLDTPPHPRQETECQDALSITPVETQKVDESKLDDAALEKTLESDCSTTNNLQIVQNDDEEVDEEIELSIHECHEESTNYYTINHDVSKDVTKREPTKLKDKFSMEVCIDDGVSIRLRATPFSLLMDQDPQTVEYFNYSYRETEMAVSSISNFDKLYTPLKQSARDQCIQFFDSTLTSLDTPLKAKSPKKMETEVTVTEIVLEVEKVEDKVDAKKRKRPLSENVSDEGASESKRAKPEAQLLFNSTNIQNFDIDSVLSKLHGP